MNVKYFERRRPCNECQKCYMPNTYFIYRKHTPINTAKYGHNLNTTERIFISLITRNINSIFITDGFRLVVLN